jgi:UDP-glucose 4-epimerase
MSLAKRTLLVTGGAGFVGSHVVARLLDAQPPARVVVLDNLRNGRREFLPASDRVAHRHLDLTNAREVRELIADVRPAVVIHLAALHFIPYCNAHPEETMHVNVVGTQNLLEACRAHPPSALVAASTAAVYPIRDGANAEDDPAEPSDIYGLSKWTNEQQVRLFSGQVPTRCAMARLFNVIGPHETNPHVLPEIVEQVLRGETRLSLGNVKPKRDYVYVTDVAEALAALAERNTHSYRVYNVGTGQEHSVEEMVAELARVSGRPLEIGVDAARVRASDRMHLLCDLSRIAGEIGWRPRYTMSTGLAALWKHATASGSSGRAEPATAAHR